MDGTGGYETFEHPRVDESPLIALLLLLGPILTPIMKISASPSRSRMATLEFNFSGSNSMYFIPEVEKSQYQFL